MLYTVDIATVVHSGDHCDLGRHLKNGPLMWLSTNNWVTAGSALSLTGSSSLESPEHSFDRSAFISFPFLVQITFIQQTFIAHLVSVRYPATSWGHREIKSHPWV